MTISEIMKEAFERVYDTRSKFEELLKEKDITYPSDLATVDEWGTVRIVSQYVIDELSKYTVDTVEHLRRVEGELISNGNAPSIHDALIVANQMMDNRTKYFDTQVDRNNVKVYYVPDGTRIYNAIDTISDIPLHISVGITPDKSILYSLDGGLTWRYYSGLNCSDIVDIQVVYSKFMRMLFFLVRGEECMYLYGATVSHDHLRKAVDLDRKSFFGNYKIINKANTSTLGIVTVNDLRREEFLVIGNMDNGIDTRVRILKIVTSDVNDIESDSSLTNGMNFIEEVDMPFDAMKTKFYIPKPVVYDSDIVNDGTFLTFDNDNILIHTVNFNDNRKLCYNEYTIIPATFVNESCVMTADIVYRIYDDTIDFLIKMSNGKYVNINSNGDIVELSNKTSFGYRCMFQIIDETLYIDEKSTNVEVAGDLLVCASDVDRVLYNGSDSLMYSIVGSSYYHGVPVAICNKISPISGDCIRIVKGNNNEMFMSDFYSNKLFISYNYGDTWLMEEMPDNVVGIFFVQNTWFIFLKNGIVLTSDSSIDSWHTGALFDIPSVGLEGVFIDGETTFIYPEIIGNNIKLSIIHNNGENVFDGYVAYASFNELMDANATINFAPSTEEPTIVDEYIPTICKPYMMSGFSAKENLVSNSTSIMEPKSGKLKKNAYRNLAYGSGIDVLSTDIPYDDIHGFYDVGGVPVISTNNTNYVVRIESEGYAIPNVEIGWSVDDMIFANDFVIVRQNDIILKDSTAMLSYGSDEIDVVTDAENSLVLYSSTTNSLEFYECGFNTLNNVRTFTLPDSNRIIDMVYYKGELWTLVESDIFDVDMVVSKTILYLYPLTLYKVLSEAASINDLSVILTVTPDKAILLCEMNGRTHDYFIEKSNEGIYIFTDKIYFFDGFNVNLTNINLDVSKLSKVEYKEPYVCVYSDKLIGFIIDSQFIEYDTPSEFYQYIRGSVYQLYRNTNGNISVRIDGANYNPIYTHDSECPNPDIMGVSNTFCGSTNDVTIYNPNMYSQMNFGYGIDGDSITMWLMTREMYYATTSGSELKNMNISEDSDTHKTTIEDGIDLPSVVWHSFMC